MRRKSNTVRIIGGAWRSRLLRFPRAADLRPTPDRVRETLFNWLGQDLTGKTCLDLYAGSGALGFEAASRGAAEVTLVERDRAAFAALEQNAARLGARNLRLLRTDALEFVNSARARYDVIFLDPPFSAPLAPQLLDRLPRLLAPGGVVYLERGRTFEPGAGWRVSRQARAGDVHYQLLDWKEDDHSRLSGNI